MKILRATTPLISVLVLLPAPASAVALLGADLQALAAFSNTAVTAGAGATIFGSLMAGDVATAGETVRVWGDYTTGGAAVIGAGRVIIGGNIDAGGAVTTGDSTLVLGNIVTGAAATLGASSVIDGNVVAAAAVTAGALADIGGDVLAGAAASIGAGATVTGSVGAVAAITLGAGAQVGGTYFLSAPPVDSVALAAALADRVASTRVQVLAAQSALNTMAVTGFLTPLLTTDTVLLSGVYSATTLSTTAATVLTLDGQGLANPFWIFNISDSLTTGANTRIVLLNGATNSSIIWNTGSYASLGADSLLLGTLLSGGYVSVGANTQVTGPGNSCGGAFSALSYVTAAAGVNIGSSGCIGIDDGFDIDAGGNVVRRDAVQAVPEPGIWALWIAGFAGIGGTLRRRRLRRIAA